MNASQRRVSDALDALTAAVEDETLPNGVTWSLGYLRAWMEEGIVSERTTGATPEQIEAAAKRWHEDPKEMHWPKTWAELGAVGRQRFINSARSAAEVIVQPDERIVKAADLRAVMDAIDYVPYDIGAVLEEQMARLREVLGDA